MTIIRCVLLLVALVAWNATAASAQNTSCDASRFDALTNMWKLEPDQNTREIPAGELAAERKVMQRVVEMFKSAFVPTGAAGYYGVNYDILPQAVTNTRRNGNTWIFTLSITRSTAAAASGDPGSSTSSTAGRSGGSPGWRPAVPLHHQARVPDRQVEIVRSRSPAQSSRPWRAGRTASM